MQFSVKYARLTLALLLVEVAIAIFVHDTIIRPYIGDVIVVGLVYCGVRSVVRTGSRSAAIFSLLFAFLVEGLQYLNFLEWSGLIQYKLARIVLGTSFAWIDMLAYIIGFLLILLLEQVLHRGNRSESGSGAGTKELF